MRIFFARRRAIFAYGEGVGVNFWSIFSILFDDLNKSE